jgi:hypothetical protein
MEYLYNYAKLCNIEILKNEIAQSAISIALDYISGTSESTDIYFKAELSEGEETILDQIVDDHVFVSYEDLEKPTSKTKNVIELTWDKFKLIIDNVGLPFYSTEETDQFIKVFCILHGAYFESTIYKNLTDYEEWQEDYESKANSNGAYDHAGRQIIRTAATFKGWSYIANAFDYVTSSGTLVVKDAFGNDLSSEYDVKMYDSDNALTEIPAEAVRDVIVWKPNYDFDLMSGTFNQRELAPSDLRIWVYGGIHELGQAGNVEFVRNLNGKIVLNTKSDGRASKHIKKDIVGVPFNANQVTFVLEHEAGLSHSVGFSLEIYRQ